ncbi:protein kinase domain-containing protein [Sphaerotilus microaerophilus]|nr:winged helix-turn-helix domain-containing protein [Sphaerotilus sp. FB-5]
MELSVDGQAADIQRKPLQVLNLLLQHAGEVVRREDFILQIWRGQPTVDNVLANAITKLRNALGPLQAGWIENIPRVGYRLTGSIEKTLVGEVRTAALDLQPGAPAPGREGFRLVRRLGQSPDHDVWLARQAKTAELRVYKYLASDGNPASLRREVTISRVLLTALGGRRDLVRILDWHLDAPPCFIESEYAGDNLQDWAVEDGRLAALPRSQRLEIFLQMADAVSAAHALTVLHKDIKPANILLSPSDQQAVGWQCRLADFGSGRLLELARLGELGVTPLGLTMAAGVGSDAARGTLLYAAPELLADEPATVRSDVYSLGVLLYQLIVADFERGMHSGWERDIDDELLRADIARATDGDPARRFNSVGELTDALRQMPERHAESARLVGERAQQAELRERLARVRARRPWLVAAVGTLLLGLVSTTWFYVRASEAHAETARQLASAQALSRFLSEDLIRAGNPAYTGKRDVSMADAVIKAAGQVDTRLAKADPAARAAVHDAMRQALFYLGKYTDSVTSGGHAIAAWEGSGRSHEVALPKIRVDQAYVLSTLQRFPEAEQQLTKAEQELSQIEAPPLTLQLRLWTRRSMLLAQQQRTAQAFDAGTKAVNLAQRLLAGPLEEEDFSLAMAAIQFQSDTAGNSERYDVALSLAQELTQRTEARVGADHLRSCYARTHLAKALGDVGRVDDALPIAAAAAQCLREKVGPDSGQLASSRYVHAQLLYKAQRFGEAAKTFLDLSNTYRALQGERSLGVIVTRHNAALSLRDGGQLQEAERLLAQTIELARPDFANDAPVVQGLRLYLAAARLDQGRSDGVAALLDGLTVEALREASPGEVWEAALPFERGRYALLRGEPERAAQQLHSAKAFLTDHPNNRPNAKRLAEEVNRWLDRLGNSSSDRASRNPARP